MKGRMILGVVLSISLVVLSAHTEVPPLMNYQGKLTDETGVPVSDGDYTIQFRIYPAPSGGDLLWEEQQTVAVANGLFSVVLGDSSSIPDTVFTGPTRWLALQLSPDPEMTPRKPIVSVGYAFRALAADTAEYALEAAAGDNDWAITGNILHPAADYGLSMRQSNVLYGIYDSTHVNFGVACTTGNTGWDHKYCTVNGGYGNVARGMFATVAGGGENAATDTGASVGGGYGNLAEYEYATVSGGRNNRASGSGVVGGGIENSAFYGTIAGGGGNFASGLCAVGGGSHDSAFSHHSTIGGGSDNKTMNAYATVAGGQLNYASGMYCSISGGLADTVAGYCSFATGEMVRVTSDADYTFAFGRDFTTSTPNAVIFHNSADPIKAGIDTPSPTATLDVNGSTGYNQVRMRISYTPTDSLDANGNLGDIAWDDNYIYIKTTVGWKRAALNTF